VRLSREDGEALSERIERKALSAEEQRVLVKVLTFYFWRLFAVREAKVSLRRLQALVFGEKPKKREPPSSGGTTGDGSTGGKLEAAPGGPEVAGAEPTQEKSRPPGPGCHGADVYRAAQTVACRPEELAVGARCPACGRGPAIPGHRTGETSSVPAGTRGEGRADGFPHSGRTGAGAPRRLT
jgi:hypothetical protein